MRLSLLLTLLASSLAFAGESQQYDYLLLATNKTSTMEKELNAAAAVGYSFVGVMGGETAFGGNEVALIMSRTIGADGPSGKIYKLLATNKTSTMEKELQEMGEEGFAYKGQTVFDSAFGGRQVSVILERDTSDPAKRYSFRLLATSKTSTMQKELAEVGMEGFALLGMTVAPTAFGGNELVCVLSREE